MDYSNVKIVLIDDDELVRMTWKFAAKKATIQVLTFAQPDEFINLSSQFSSEVKIYIDENLSHGMRGSEVSKRIYELGFQNIFLATGYEPDFVQGIPWIKGIVGKEPPF